METPLTARRVTRSQALAASSNNKIPISRKIDESGKGVSKSRKPIGKPQDRSALFDITNDSPIVGLAMGILETPVSDLSKKKTNLEIKQSTPGSGSGEALLRGQVKNLLQKVEEDAELSKIPFPDRSGFLSLKSLVNSPMNLLAPTPANTPQVSNLESVNKMDMGSVESSPIEEQFNFSQIVMGMVEGKKQEIVEPENDFITRSLLLDFSENSEKSEGLSSDCTSDLTFQERSEDKSEESDKKSTEEDEDPSIWSIQVNLSPVDEEEEEDYEEVVEEDEEYDENEQEYEQCDEGLLDDICEGMSKISVEGAKFAGKHTRFVYNSDDEIEEESESPASDGSLCLKGLPTPKGKHVRFTDEE